MHFVKVHVVQPYSSTDTATACKNCYFIRKIGFSYDLCLPNAYVDITFSRWDVAAEVCELVYKYQRLKEDMTPARLEHINCVLFVAFPRLCCWDSAWPDIFMRSARSSALSASVIVSAFWHFHLLDQLTFVIGNLGRLHIYIYIYTHTHTHTCINK